MVPESVLLYPWERIGEAQAEESRTLPPGVGGVLRQCLLEATETVTLGLKQSVTQM